jgi:pyruvate kinase
MINTRKSKIVAKIADNRCEVPFLKSLFEAGADVAWLNTAHQDEAATDMVIANIRKISTTIPILIDTKGPEIRTKGLETPLEIKAGDSIILTGDSTYTGPNVILVSYPNFHNEVPVGKSVLYDDASIEFVVEEKLEKGIRCVVKSNGLIKKKKSLNIPGVHIHLPALSEKDASFIHYCAKNNVDYIIHSFVRNKEDIFEIKNILKQYPNYKGKILSKLENREGFDNVREILEHSDGLMVARGDLGAEVPIEELPYMQKKMVEAALEMGKYCIVATQVLESMIKNPRPTRAEITDASNAILDGSGAISMSGETAYGDYPFEATKTMGKIMAYTELKRDELVHFAATPKVSSGEYTFAKKAVAEADSKKVAAIVVVAKDMEITRALSAYRPNAVVVPACTDEWDMRELMMAYAARPLMVKALDKAAAVKMAKESLPKGSLIMVISEKGNDWVSEVV